MSTPTLRAPPTPTTPTRPSQSPFRATRPVTGRPPRKDKGWLGAVPMWSVPSVLVILALVGLQLLTFQPAGAAPLTAQVSDWASRQRRLSTEPTARKLLPEGGGGGQPAEQQQQPAAVKRLDKAALKALRSKRTCHQPEGAGALPDQRVCVFEDLVLYNGRLLYVTDNASEALPAVKISHKPKFEGDDLLQLAPVTPGALGFSWDNATVEEVGQAGLFHQQHYSNFYHMLSEEAPSVHYIMCKYLGDCTYSPSSSTRLFWVQEWRPGMPQYIMLDTIVETFRCLTPHPVLKRDDPALAGKVLVLRKAVAGIGSRIRVFHEWRDEHKAHYSEPPAPEMLGWRQRVADCFGFDFAKAMAPTDPLRVLFINRHWREGRHIVNHADLAHTIEKLPELQAFPSVDVRMHYLNSDDKLRDQAELFWNTSILIWPHGATMALTFFLPKGAQAIEVIPWVEDDKLKQKEWVEAIRDAFSLDIWLTAVQNKERRRYMYNLDDLLANPKYRDATPEQKVALLERGECPPGIDELTCPIWWNHWQSSVNLDWATLEPAVKTAIGKLAEQRRAATAAAAAGAGAGAVQGGSAAAGAAQQ